MVGGQAWPSVVRCIPFVGRLSPSLPPHVPIETLDGFHAPVPGDETPSRYNIRPCPVVSLRVRNVCSSRRDKLEILPRDFPTELFERRIKRAHERHFEYVAFSVFIRFFSAFTAVNAFLTKTRERKNKYTKNEYRKRNAGLKTSGRVTRVVTAREK